MGYYDDPDAHNDIAFYEYESGGERDLEREEELIKYEQYDGE